MSSDCHLRVNLALRMTSCTFLYVSGFFFLSQGQISCIPGNVYPVSLILITPNPAAFTLTLKMVRYLIIVYTDQLHVCF